MSGTLHSLASGGLLFVTALTWATLMVALSPKFGVLFLSVILGGISASLYWLLRGRRHAVLLATSLAGLFAWGSLLVAARWS
ncbi:MAG: hypothetical protein K1X74_21905 [Pirellulales bacterium]|nr:hypothetical protein [Pirellulales bacterium]